VTVTGTGFFASHNLFCRFDPVVVAATYSTATLVECISPVHNAGAAAVELSFNGYDYTSDGVEAYYGSAFSTFHFRFPVDALS
jgi:hypothetical protein